MILTWDLIPKLGQSHVLHLSAEPPAYDRVTSNRLLKDEQDGEQCEYSL